MREILDVHLLVIIFRSRLVMKRRALMDSTWTTFTHEFTKEAWYATLAFMVLVPPILTFVTHYSPSEKEKVSLRDAYVITVGAIAYQGTLLSASPKPLLVHYLHLVHV